MDTLEIKDFYEHEQSPSVFIMFKKNQEVIWSFSGNMLRQVYLEHSDDFISGPIEVAIPKYLDKVLTDALDNF